MCVEYQWQQHHGYYGMSQSTVSVPTVMWKLACCITNHHSWVSLHHVKYFTESKVKKKKRWHFICPFLHSPHLVHCWQGNERFKWLIIYRQAAAFIKFALSHLLTWLLSGSLLSSHCQNLYMVEVFARLTLIFSTTKQCLNIYRMFLAL